MGGGMDLEKIHDIATSIAAQLQQPENEGGFGAPVDVKIIETAIKWCVMAGPDNILDETAGVRKRLMKVVIMKLRGEDIPPSFFSMV
ncbi:MAG: hypothetical protein WC835_00880 [Candidatus Paceibacterota bacterium]